jgi:hypothetical protein
MPSYLSIFLEDERVPEPDDVLGTASGDELPPQDLPTPRELSEEPDIKVGLAAAEKLASLA